MIKCRCLCIAFYTTEVAWQPLLNAGASAPAFNDITTSEKQKQNKEKFDFKAFGQAIKAARKAKGISRNQLADTLNIAPRYIASIENSGQHPSLQILYELVTLLDVSVDQFFFPEREQEKSTRRRQLDTMLDTMSETDLKIMSATAKGIEEANNDRTGE